MSELLPTVQAANVRRSLVAYLTTTFALSDGDARDGLDRFLSHAVTGMFKGPYVRLRLPFRPADDGWREPLEWYEGPRPYGHQAAAFARLASSVDGVARRPLPTLVTTGTGSGKTEAFLHPILDHVLRARRGGVQGTKALILYPMNALANDQAQRLARILTSRPELSGITAALYIGQSGTPRLEVTEDGLITDRAIIRDSAPDILLTNYKMLDQLLLRHEDQKLWRDSADSLQYMVLDEFHTYDGAQGTDVAMLLRRLGLALASHRPGTGENDPRPLGDVTPVATSATLGDKGDPAAMVDFARTVFGEELDEQAVVTESRLSVDEWVGDDGRNVATIGATPLDIAVTSPADAVRRIDELGDDPEGAQLATTVLRLLYDVPEGFIEDADDERLLLLARAHPLVQTLAGLAADAIALDELVDQIIPLALPTDRPAWQRVLAAVVGMLGHVRAVAGRDALSVETHLWVRELTRIDRAADSTVTFRWGDDGPPMGSHDADDVRPSFPAIYCRHCGRSGWQVALAPVGTDLASSDERIRADHANREGRSRALLHAPGEADSVLLSQATVEGLVWFSVRNRSLVTSAPDEDDAELRDGWLLPVLTTVGKDADEEARADTCPSCGQADGIRFLGSAIATLLSVSLSTLFGSDTLAPQEKKALVFTDSVQDAAHRAGFVQARSHALTLRAVLRDAVDEGSIALPDLADELIRRAADSDDSRSARYRLIPPDVADRDSFEEFWKKDTLRAVPTSVRNRVGRRLALDIALEFGLNSRTGRTLELTGSVAAEVEAGQPSKLAAIARAAVEQVDFQRTLERDGSEPDDAMLVRWVRGVLERMRTQGAIDHPWFVAYRYEDGSRWPIWGGRPRQDGMPAFPDGRPMPAFPQIGGGSAASKGGLDAVTSSQSWYARWASRVLGVSPADGAKLARGLLERLAKDGVLLQSTSKSGAAVYALPPSAVVVAPTLDEDLAAGRHLLVCDRCQAPTPGTVGVVAQLADGPCLATRCDGTVRRAALEDNFYRHLYSASGIRRIVAREHTSLLPDEVRLAYENGFKASADDPQAPNVLVATPTLEMGIDIGDLSTVFLSSLPRTVASYLQRVGRAGRLTGNALDLAFVTGRGDQLPRLGDPLSVINGEVRPPATYLDAEEILQRQFVAHLVDRFARDPERPHPRRAAGAIGSTEPGTFLGDLIATAEADAEEHVDRFLAGFDRLAKATAESLRQWVEPGGGPGTSALAEHLRQASQRWRTTIDVLRQRLAAVEKLIPELEQKADSPAVTEDDRVALRSAVATRRLTRGQLAHLQGEYWIAVLEEYGILPNYTLLDDGVTLDVGLSWVDPDSNAYQSEHASFRRGSAQAIREFAPGATFYARGWEIVVDAIDLGMDGESIRPWVFCPACGFGVDIAATGTEHHPSECPRCGNSAIADAGQRLDVVELTHVTSEIRRDEAGINDRREQRESLGFEVVTAADIDPGSIVSRWYARGVGLGCTYLRSMSIRWLNVGKRGLGNRRMLAGDERAAPLFRVCAGCGKLDTEPGRNSPHEHRPWCSFRQATEENTRSVALSRTLDTQGLLLRLPYSVSVGDMFAVPSLAAAVLLGLREQIGGHPDHVQVAQVVEPTLSDGTDNHDALLLHDVVPGGTGYLAELADAERLHDLLVLAWEKVRDCECRHEERLACHRCLLPFALSGQVGKVSRAVAERHLRTLLGLAPDADSAAGTYWETTDTPPADDRTASALEQRFYELVLERLGPQGLGASIVQTPGPWGNKARITLPGSSRQWTLEPQVTIGTTRPDFVLRSNDTNVPEVAIYVDGRAFHATSEHNRLREDAENRQWLRDSGRLVVSVTAADLHDATNKTGTPPTWFSEPLIAQLMMVPQLMASPAAYAELKTGPIDWLLAWLGDPNPADLVKVARSVPMFLTGGAQPVSLAAGEPLAGAARGVLIDSFASSNGSGRTVQVWRSGAVAAAIEMSTSPFQVGLAIVLDDRDSALTADHGDAWREWLRLGNCVPLRDWPTTITTVSAVEEALPEDRTPDRPPVCAEFRLAYDQARPGPERELIRRLSEVEGLEPPLVGVEGPDGIPLDLSWKSERIAVYVDELSEADLSDLDDADWQVFGSEQVDRLIEALLGSAGRDES